jgi:acetoacetyl-CoA synthetase
MARYMDWLSTRRGLYFPDYARDGYERLWEWSVREPEEFWASLWEYFGVIHSQPYERVLASRAMPGAEGAQWFTGARLNYAENVLGGSGDPESPALIHASEVRDQDVVTRAELRERVAATASALRELGVEKGDRVVAYLPNVPEAVVAFLASASIGAVYSSCSPDFGAPAVMERFSQIEPKVLFACDGYRYGGKDFDRTETVAELRREIPSLEHTVLLPYLNENPDTSRLSSSSIPWDDLVRGHENAELRFEQVPFDHPLWVLYSSGTTGLPKAIVQGHGGILLEHLKKVRLHMDLGLEDRFFWFTTTGWMMWNLLVSGLLGGPIVLYDGSPGHPDMGAMWRFAEEAGITVFGTSAGYLTACMKAGLEPGRDHDLSVLRAMGSTGSPLPPEGFEWVYEHVKRELHLFSTSGGTDLCTAFVGGSPLLPVRAGELQCRALGASVHAFDEAGLPVIDDVGELVITAPMPSMPLYLWNDPEGEKYHESYFDHYPGVWRHGDWIQIKPTGACVIHGRSDSTINRGGIRMGTAEIYSAVESVDGVADSLVVDVPVSNDSSETRIYLFVVPEEGRELDEELVSTVKRGVREHCSPRHVPDEILAIEEVPRTLNGKKLEVPVKKILSGKPVEEAASRDSLANPRVLDYFAGLEASRG